MNRIQSSLQLSQTILRRSPDSGVSISSRHLVHADFVQLTMSNASHRTSLQDISVLDKVSNRNARSLVVGKDINTG